MLHILLRSKLKNTRQKNRLLVLPLTGQQHTLKRNKFTLTVTLLHYPLSTWFSLTYSGDITHSSFLWQSHTDEAWCLQVRSPAQVIPGDDSKGFSATSNLCFLFYFILLYSPRPSARTSSAPTSAMSWVLAPASTLRAVGQGSVFWILHNLRSISHCLL